jgi:photosystem II stability/assembly factor-like uncharacterized protein
VTWTEANERRDRIGATRTLAAVAAGTGVAASAAGIWWLATHPASKVVVVPHGAGVGLVARF